MRRKTRKTYINQRWRTYLWVVAAVKFNDMYKYCQKEVGKVFFQKRKKKTKKRKGGEGEAERKEKKEEREKKKRKEKKKEKKKKKKKK